MKHKGIATICFISFFINACAIVATGPEFSELHTPAPGRGEVYIYRTAAIYAIGQPFSLSVDGEDIGKLFNASFLEISLPPGFHSFSVDPGGISKTSKLDIDVKAGETIFYQYAFNSSIFANAIFTGSAIQRREKPMALSDLKSLKNAAPAAIQVSSGGAFAQIEDIDAVPGLTSHGKKSYSDWLKKSSPRAFAICSDGKISATWGHPQDNSQPADAAERALFRAREIYKFSGCKLYAVDNKVVYTP